MPRSTPIPGARPRGWRFVLLAMVALGVFLLCASLVVAASSAAQTPDITVEAERTVQGAKLSIRGRNWPAGEMIILSASRPPGGPAELDFGRARANSGGEFRATKLSPCTTPTLADTRAQVTVTARAGSVTAERRIDASAWVCLSGG